MAAFDTSDILTTGLTVNGKTILSGNSSNNILTISGTSGAIMTVQDNASTTLLSVSTTGGTAVFSVYTTGIRAHSYIYDSTNSTGSTNQVLSSTASGVAWATASGGGMSWSEVTSTSQTMSINTGYIANNVALVTLTLPTTSALGSVIEVVGKGAGLWKIAQNAGEQIHFGNINTTSGTGGYLQATLTYDAIRLVCTVADTEWTVTSSQGNITVV
jgi:hypothetical protein